ncbi:MAG: MXAN_6640 family putative metalloprotease [bacterium]
MKKSKFKIIFSRLSWLNSLLTTCRDMHFTPHSALRTPHLLLCVLCVSAVIFFIQGVAVAKMSDEDILYLYYSRNHPEKIKTDARFANRALPKQLLRGTMDGTMTSLLVVRSWDYLSPETREELSEYIQVGEMRDGKREVSASVGACSTYLSGISEQRSSAHFTVIYTTKSGSQDAVSSTGTGNTPAYIENMISYAEEVYQKEITTLGFKSPPLQSGGKYQIYICDLMGRSGNTLLGRTNTVDIYIDYTATSYIELDNEYSTYYLYSDSVENLIRGTLAHEYFHAIQFGLNYRYPSFWILEATASAIESEVYPNICDYLNLYVETRFANLDIPIDYFSFDDVYGYGAAIFFRYITEKVSGSSTLKGIWDLVKNDTKDCETGYTFPCYPENEVTEMSQISQFLTGKGTTLNSVMTGFEEANYKRDYVSASGVCSNEFPSVIVSGSFTSYPASQSAETLEHLAAMFYKFNPESTTDAKKLTVSFSGDSGISWSAALVLRTLDGNFQTETITLTGGAGSVAVDGFGTFFVDAVLIVTNLSTSKTSSGDFSFTASTSNSCAVNTPSQQFSAGWNMVTFPVIPLSSDPSDAVTVVNGGTKLSNTNIVYYDPTDEKNYYGFQAGFQGLGKTGQGYWVSLSNASSLSVAGCTSSDTTIDVELLYGWNMFGSPFTTDVKWDDTAVQVIQGSATHSLSDAIGRGWLAAKIYNYNGSGYDEILANNSTVLSPWKAYWLKVYKGVILRFKK